MTSIFSRVIGLYIGQACVFLAATINIRACAKGWVTSALMTDALILSLNFTFIKWIGESTGYAEQIAYIVGGVSGSAIGMYLTRKWEDKNAIND